MAAQPERSAKIVQRHNIAAGCRERPKCSAEEAKFMCGIRISKVVRRKLQACCPDLLRGFSRNPSRHVIGLS